MKGDHHARNAMPSRAPHRLVCALTRAVMWALTASIVATSVSAVTPPTVVAVSVLPQKYFVERVAGPGVRVQVMVGPGQSPATYAPTARQMAALSHAAIYFSIGVPFEQAWMRRIRNLNPSMRIVDIAAGLRRSDAVPNATRVHDEPVDPHVWTDPRLVRTMAARIRDALIEHDGAHRADYARNDDAFAADLEELDRGIRARMNPLHGRTFVVFHPSWGYFAHAYGLRQLAIESAGKEPGPASLQEVIAHAQSLHARVIFAQPQFSRRTARMVAEEIGARVELLDPLAENYLDNMRQVANRIATALVIP